jgi:hypothetical protein
MRAKKLLEFHLPILGILLAACIGATCLWRFNDCRTQERRLQELARDVAFADDIKDNRKAVRVYESLSPSLPEIQLRILQRQWEMALDLIGQIQRSKFNATLEKDVPGLYDQLLAHLEKMRDRCGALISESGEVPDEVLWQAYNAGAAARLLTAYATLETERNWPKVQGIILESLADLKMAIGTVDKLPGATPDKNIPRWNLELLYDQQYVEKFSLFSPENQDRMDLKDNLEMLIPERGGYAPGEPMDRSIRK